MGQDIDGWEKWIYTFVQQHQLPVSRSTGDTSLV